MAGFGETLHQARAHMGVTLKEAEQATRINRHHLAALEEENFAALPPLIYQRGIVRNYAQYLQLDPGKLLLMFEEAQGGTGQLPSARVAAVPPVNMPSHWAPNFAIIAFALVLSAIVFAWVYSAFVAQPDIELTPTVPVPTATPFENDIPVPTQAPTQVPPTDEPEPTDEPAATQPAASSSRETSNQRGGDNVRSSDDDAAESSDTETAAEPTAEPTDEPVDTSNMTSIRITANADLYLTVTADGEVVFDGNVAAGETTEYFTATTFEVYTSWGEMTIFSNNCGDEYQMGYEGGQATYTLTREPDSCAAVD
jgi:cytoskeleton protein RodZ